MSDRDQWPDNPNEPPSRVRYRETQEGSGGGCLKVALIVGAVGGLVLLVCCGGLVWFGWGFVPKMATTPEAVAELSKDIMKIDIPADYVGEAGMAVDNWMLAMRFASYRHKEGKGKLLIGHLQVKIGDLEDQQGDFKAKTRQQTDKDPKLEIAKTEEREFIIRGNKVPFKFSEADEAGTKKKFRLVTGEIESPGGIMIFQLTLEEDAYDEEAVVKMIESIQ